MIYLLESPTWEIPSIPINTYGSKTFSVAGRKRLLPFRCVARDDELSITGWALEIGKVYPQKTLLYEMKFMNPVSEYWAEVTFKNLFIREMQHELDGSILYTCEAEDFMITLESRDDTLSWLEKEALMIDRNNYLNGS